ncbi:class I SAM-dependent methyltransferase [Algoriphagus sediminis]|uniref:Class I SAM-dependent methyltransferase n=1 Tax=Algoriphagus sediminis TaxID=3057113 RepID=A0ABT7Y906_9BACT|nr:class I SAM-dependent methyltransferase [Algoriphagus sediminis]MDN3203003.1 class I SAM-dependent methyltransferase [Algoriphagus sediminis]
MKKLTFLFVSYLTVLLGWSCEAQNANDENSPYTITNPTRDGTGKIYLGREISQIMGFAGKDWLERQNREQEESVSKAIENLPVDGNSVVADIGAGSGYYTFRVAPKVPDGKVYAVEIQDAAIDYLNQKANDLGFTNVETIKGSEKSPNLPEGAVDLAFMVDVYHELEYPVEMLANIRKALKPNGKLLLIEYRGEDPTIMIKPLHKMTAAQAKKEMKANGFKFVENGKFMKIQHFLVFEKDPKFEN